MPLAHNEWITALVGRSEGHTPCFARLANEGHRVPSLLQVAFGHLPDIVLPNPINVEDSLADSDRGHIKEDAHVRGTTKVARVKDSVAVDQEKLGIKVGAILLQSLEKDRVNWHFLEGQKARDVWVVGRLFLEVLIEDIHGGELKDDQRGNCLLLIVLRVADIHSTDSFQGRLGRISPIKYEI